MSPAKKHIYFVKEPVGNKPVIALPGIGKTYAEKLAQKGFPYAFNVCEKFREMEMNQAQFSTWLKTMCGANSHHTKNCYYALCVYHDRWLPFEKFLKHLLFAIKPPMPAIQLPLGTTGLLNPLGY